MGSKVAVLVLSFVVLALGSSSGAVAQDDESATSSPTAAEESIEPSEPPTPEPTPSASPAATPSPLTTSSPAATTPSAAPSTAPYVPVLPRTPPRDTSKLVELLAPLTEWGVPLDLVLVEGTSRFPVGGRAHYSDDWLAPRYEPDFHLHRGLDIFADFDTPVRAPTAGVVTALSDAYPGGTSVTIRDYEGTTYYFAHLSARAEWLEVGRSVELGTVLGTVGDTGNASGGAPHLHLEIRRGGVTVPPKPIVDAWLDEAEAAAGDWVEARRLEIEMGRPASAGNGIDAEPAGSLTQLLLDIAES